MRRTLKPNLTRPPDFESFWQATIQELARTERRVARQAVSGSSNPQLILEDISFDSFGAVRLNGYLVRWRDEKQRPLVVHSHGYGCQCAIQWDWARLGVNVLGVDLRGHGRSAAALPNRSKWGHILTGIESPETSVLRGVICDYVRAVEVARSIFNERIVRTVLHGVSFAGGVALMAEAVSHTADFLVIGVPTFGWSEGRHFFVRSGSGAEISQYLEDRPESIEDVMLTLRYFDSMNFAAGVTCPTLVGVGLSDDVVPAKTVYAIANHLGGPFEIMEFPVSHTELPEERLWKKFEQRWLHLTCHGIGEDFGDSVQRITH